MPGTRPYELPSSEGLIKGTNKETGSAISKYTGGSLLGWNLFAKTKVKFILYDNVEKAEGTNYGLVSLNERESIRDWFGPNGLEFKVALWLKLMEGELEGVVFADIE